MKSETILITPTTLSGSTDLFRTAIGGCWETVSVVPTIPDGADQGIFAIEPLGQTANEIPALRPFINEVLINSASNHLSNEVIVPNYKLYVRLTGQKEVVKSDDHWRTLLVGGTYGNSTYAPIYTASIFNNTSFSYWIPYNQYETNLFSTINPDTDDYWKASISAPIKVEAVYNTSLPEYEQYVNQLDSELLIPNIYWMRTFDIFRPDRTGFWAGSYLSYTSYGDTFASILKHHSSLYGADEAFSAYHDAASGYLESYGSLHDEHYFVAQYSASIERLMTREDNVSPALLALPQDINSDGFYENENYHIYLTSSIINNAISASTSQEIQRIFKNIIFDNESMYGERSVLDEMTSTLYDLYQDPLEANEDFEYFVNYKTRFPYYVSIEIPLTKPYITGMELWEWDRVRNFIQDSQYIPKFLRTLKDAYTNKIPEITPEDKLYFAYSTYYDSDSSHSRISQYTTASAQTLRVVDLMELLVHGHNQFKYNPSEVDCCFMGPDSINRKVATDTTGMWRYLNSAASLDTIMNFTEWLKEDVARSDEEAYPRSTIGNLDDLYSLQHDLNNSRMMETVAYRIEKIGGTPTNDDKTQNVIQNIWFWNSRADESGGAKILPYYDTQIKYNTNYTYKIYAYVLTAGWEYKYSNLALTRQLARPQSTYIDADGAFDGYCLEYYDPTTDEPTPALPLPQFYREFYDHVSWEELGMDHSYYGNPNATAALQYSSDKYRAEFVLDYQPVIKIVEVPLYSKTLKVTDNPPNRLQVSPAQLTDNSQRILFELKYAADHVDVYPAVLTPKDSQIKTDYMNSRNLAPGQEITREHGSRSPQTSIEVYRLDEKPKTIGDFGKNLRATLSLSLAPEEKIGKSKTIYNFYDKVKTNLKYYYVFRVINEKGIPGDLSPIYEAQLVDDGGYKFSIFNILTNEEMKERPFAPSKPLKKIFEILPNINHLTLNTGSVDYTQPAHTQIGNISVGSPNIEEYIWGKTYKFRLTSKKTGRKIDLNIKYNEVNSE
jgi:hypothetical protein